MRKTNTADSVYNGKTLPTVDYISIIASLYRDKRAMVVGMAATIIAVLLAAVKTGAPVLFVIALVFAVSTGFRYANMAAFERNPPHDEDRAAARYWERQQMLHGTWTAFLYGSWCFVTFVFVSDPFAELVCISVSVAAMIGVSTRTFGLDSLVTAQMVAIAVPIAAGLVLAGDLFHLILASLLLPLIISFKFLAADVRRMLLTAVHQRLASTQLALQLDTALETMHHGLCMIDANGVVALANEQAKTTFHGLSKGSWDGRLFSDLLQDGVERKLLSESSANDLQRMIAAQVDGKIVLAMGDEYYCEVSVSSRGDRTVLLFDDISERVLADERINYMARFDTLTGLPNRTYFTEQMDIALKSRRKGNAEDPVLLAIINLDEFKTVNDTYGHLTGDKVLAETARRIQAAMHKNSRLGRFGGDEFIFYRAIGTSGKSAETEVSAIRSALAEPFEVDGQRIELQASVGYVTQDSRNMGLDDLVSRADLALNAAKSLGKNQLQGFVTEMEDSFRYRQRLKADLADAIAQDQLHLAYQPLIDLKTRRIAACEALARWTHPELGPIRPDEFISLAEEVGMVSAITRWVLRTAAQECARWPEPIAVSVNVSGRDLRGDGLDQLVSQALGASGLPPERLEIEVTETALIEERVVAARRLTELAKQGIGIALDDFGTGYSSLSYLKEMPFTKLKIDRAFIGDLASNRQARVLLQNVARLGKGLDLTVTAEGVETEDQLELITRETQIDQVQGYFFSRPVPGPEIRDLIAKMNPERPVLGNSVPVLSPR